MKITLKYGVIKEFEQAVSVLDIAKAISEGLARNACAGIVDGEVQDLRFVVDKDAEVSICTFADDAGKHAFRHTTSHVLAQAVNRLYQMRSWQLGQRLRMASTMTLTATTPSHLKNWKQLKLK